MRYAIRQAWRNIRASRWIVFQTLLMMFVSLFLLSAFGLVALQAQRILSHWEGEAPVLVYLKDKVPAKELKTLEKTFSMMVAVKKVKLLSPAKAMKRLKESLGDKKNLLEELDAPLLPFTIELSLREEAKSRKRLLSLQKELSQLKGVSEVDVGGKWFEPLWKLTKWLRLILWAGGGLLLLCIVLIASGTIRLSLLSHREELEVMRLIGATERHIRLPYYFEAVWEGGVAGLWSLAVLYGLFLLLQHYYANSFQSFTSISLQFFTPPQMLLFLLGGIIAAFCGCWFALRSKT